MAFVRSLKQGASKKNAHPTEVDAEWYVVHTVDGSLLQISTFGSDERQAAGKQSQTIQLDFETARNLASIIEQVFPES